MRLALGIALALLACDAPPSEVRPFDVPVIESRAPAWGGTRHLDPRPVLEIGAAAGEGPDVFGTVSSVRLVSGGRIAVGDSQADRIQVFDSLGSHVATLGRPGEGPGEFADLGRIYPFPGDSVAGFDFGLNRTVVFPLSGGASRTVSGVHFAQRAPVLGVLETGSLIAYQPLPLTHRPMDGEWDSTRVILVESTAGQGRDVRHLPSSQSEGAPGSPPTVLAPRSVMGAARDGFYWARSDQYEIHRYDSLGTLRQVIRRPVEPERMTSADEQEYREAAIAGAREAGGDRAAQGVVQRLRDATFAPTRPLFGSTFVDRDGRLWISELPWPSRFVAPRRWSVFSETGEWLGEVLVPQDFWVQDASGDRVVGIWRDELGVSFVRIHRMGNSD